VEERIDELPTWRSAVRTHTRSPAGAREELELNSNVEKRAVVRI